MRRIVSSLLCALTAGVSANAVAAQPFVPVEKCAIIAASRQTLDEVRDFGSDMRVFASVNGWYAIVAGVVPRDHAETLIAQGKALGLYPDDAYCSAGHRLVRELDWAQEVALAAPKPPAASVITKVLPPAQMTQPRVRSILPAPQAMQKQVYPDLDPRRLGAQDRRFLQLAMTLDGAYDGPLDGAWGQVSHKAFLRAADDSATAFLQDTHAVLKADGWEIHRDGALSVALPMGGLEADPTVSRTALAHRDGTLTVTLDTLGTSAAKSIHRGLLAMGTQTQMPERLRRAERWETTVTADGKRFHAVSLRDAGAWRTLVVVAENARRGDAKLIAASLRFGEPLALEPAPNGRLAAFLRDGEGHQSAALASKRLRLGG